MLPRVTIPRIALGGGGQLRVRAQGVSPSFPRAEHARGRPRRQRAPSGQGRKSSQTSASTSRAYGGQNVQTAGSPGGFRSDQHRGRPRDLDSWGAHGGRLGSLCTRITCAWPARPGVSPTCPGVHSKRAVGQGDPICRSAHGPLPTTRPSGPQPCCGVHGGHRQPTGMSPRPPRPAARSAVRVGVADTDPDSSTTGTWSKPFSRKISMVCSQVTVGSTVSGADRLSSWTRRCHHLSDSAGRAVNRGPGARALWPHGGLWGRRSSPRLGHREVFLLQEALLQHPLVAQEL